MKIILSREEIYIYISSYLWIFLVCRFRINQNINAVNTIVSTCIYICIRSWYSRLKYNIYSLTKILQSPTRKLHQITWPASHNQEESNNVSFPSPPIHSYTSSSPSTYGQTIHLSPRSLKFKDTSCKDNKEERLSYARSSSHSFAIFRIISYSRHVGRTKDEERPTKGGGKARVTHERKTREQRRRRRRRRRRRGGRKGGGGGWRDPHRLKEWKSTSLWSGINRPIPSNLPCGGSMRPWVRSREYDSLYICRSNNGRRERERWVVVGRVRSSRGGGGDGG